MHSSSSALPRALKIAARFGRVPDKRPALTEIGLPDIPAKTSTQSYEEAEVQKLILLEIRHSLLEMQEDYLGRRRAEALAQDPDIGERELVRQSAHYVRELAYVALESWEQKEIPWLLRECTYQVAQHHDLASSHVGPAALKAFEQWLREDCNRILQTSLALEAH